ncbi:MAG: threonine--tRNA ligase [bacterium]
MEIDNLYRLRHSLAHVLAIAVLEEFPEAKLAIGPPVDNGFYYDFELPCALQPEDLPALQERMKKILPQGLGFAESTHSINEALERFKDQPYKAELIRDLAEKGETEVTFYTSGDFVDLCKGGHVESTAEIPVDCFALSHASGAYWRGDEKRPMLQRIYGLAFETADELKAYQTMMEEAKKRDHRKLGAELDLFTFSDLVGSGLPLWTPKGTILRNLLDDYVGELRANYDYQKVEIPHITKRDLYEKSGHWEKFQEELFRIKTREGHEFVMKPMNCPHHTQIFDRRKWSYREMPARYANTTMCYRDEQSGELSGLSRTRAFSQDDAHVFCRYDQSKEEQLKVWEIIETFYKSFGFELSMRLSFHDPSNMGAYLGTEEEWQQAENELKELMVEKGVEYEIGIGEAAFYGPKIDFMAKDSIGRKWQVATLQVDKNQPSRFGLTYTAEDGSEQPVLMIHAAIMGSIDRFLSVFIEHVAGNFPFWLSPVQVSVLPVNDQCFESARELATLLKKEGLRVTVDESSESVGKKIRNASVQKTPVKLVLGLKEIEAFKESGVWKVKPNWRTDLAELGEEEIALDQLLSSMRELVATKKF